MVAERKRLQVHNCNWNFRISNRQIVSTSDSDSDVVSKNISPLDFKAFKMRFKCCWDMGMPCVMNVSCSHLLSALRFSLLLVRFGNQQRCMVTFFQHVAMPQTSLANSLSQVLNTWTDSLNCLIRTSEPMTCWHVPTYQTWWAQMLEGCGPGTETVYIMIR